MCNCSEMKGCLSTAGPSHRCCQRLALWVRWLQLRCWWSVGGPPSQSQMPSSSGASTPDPWCVPPRPAPPSPSSPASCPEGVVAAAPVRVVRRRYLPSGFSVIVLVCFCSVLDGCLTTAGPFSPSSPAPAWWVGRLSRRWGWSVGGPSCHLVCSTLE